MREGERDRKRDRGRERVKDRKNGREEHHTDRIVLYCDVPTYDMEHYMDNKLD